MKKINCLAVSLPYDRDAGTRYGVCTGARYGVGAGAWYGAGVWYDFEATG